MIKRTHIGAWLSLAERTIRDRKAEGSNPPAPTSFDQMRSSSVGESAGFITQMSRARFPPPRPISRSC